jgi:hypothetical protein
MRRVNIILVTGEIACLLALQNWVEFTVKVHITPVE